LERTFPPFYCPSFGVSFHEIRAITFDLMKSLSIRRSFFRQLLVLLIKVSKKKKKKETPGIISLLKQLKAPLIGRRDRAVRRFGVTTSWVRWLDCL
jgi:hypothetical protein